MRKLFSLATTALAFGKGVIALNSFLKTRRRAQAKAVASDALEIRTSDGQTVIYKPVDSEGRSVDTVEEATSSTSDKSASDKSSGEKPHQDKASRMNLAEDGDTAKQAG
ncbi:hypothetical protein [Hyphococcus sp.]|uniref:hypothetical protein n=1 Tax=Hyphococcus sp. TaxID=2038636 RepID=UPI003CCC28B4